jgi:hypothetical protein
MRRILRVHLKDLEEAGKRIGRSKDASLKLSDERLGHLRIVELKASGRRAGTGFR